MFKMLLSLIYDQVYLYFQKILDGGIKERSGNLQKFSPLTAQFKKRLLSRLWIMENKYNCILHHIVYEDSCWLR